MGKPDVLSPAEAEHAFELAQSDYRPREILEKKAEIDKKTSLVYMSYGHHPEADEVAVKELVRLRLQLDGLYAAWVRGEIS